MVACNTKLHSNCQLQCVFKQGISLVISRARDVRTVMQRTAQVSYGKLTDSDNSRWKTTASEKAAFIGGGSSMRLGAEGLARC